MEFTEKPWIYFCDFKEITHIGISECRVSVHRQDNKCLVSDHFLLPISLFACVCFHRGSHLAVCCTSGQWPYVSVEYLCDLQRPDI